MSDDTKALVERAREVAGYKYQHHTIHVPVVLNMLADTIERLERERDELRERCERMRRALELSLMRIDDDGFYCAGCGAHWSRPEAERHAEGCLAA